jgi:hypothetical protein
MKISSYAQIFSIALCIMCAMLGGPFGALYWFLGMLSGAVTLGALERERHAANRPREPAP